MTLRQRIGWCFAKVAQWLTLTGARIAGIEEQYGSVEREIEAWRTGSRDAEPIEPTPTIVSYRLALAMHEAKKVGGPWTPCGPNTDFGAPFDCECAAMGRHLAEAYDTWPTDPSLADRLADKLRSDPAIQQLTQSRVYSGSPSAYAGPTGDAAVHYHEPTNAIPSGYGHQHAHNGSHEHDA